MYMYGAMIIQGTIHIHSALCSTMDNGHMLESAISHNPFLHLQNELQLTWKC